jgi:hypothetical protein
MIRSTNDPNLYYIGDGPLRVQLVLYVDNLFMIGGDEAMITWLKIQLHRQFDMSDLGLVTRYLGVEFWRLA